MGGPLSKTETVVGGLLVLAIEFAAIRARRPMIQVGDLPPELTVEGVSNLADDRERYLEALVRARGNRTEAARQLGVSRATFYRRVAELDLDLS